MRSSMTFIDDLILQDAIEACIEQAIIEAQREINYERK